ncbi:unnamed protein product [Arctogadus glacialis]
MKLCSFVYFIYVTIFLVKKNQRTSSSCFGEPVLVVHVRDSFVVNESVATDFSLVSTQPTLPCKERRQESWTVANMSRDLYYPHSPESQDSPQRPYQPACAHVGPGNVGEPSHMVPGSTHASYGVYAGTSMNPSHMYPSMHPGSMGYIPAHPVDPDFHRYPKEGTYCVAVSST